MSSISQMYLNDTEGDCVIAEMCHSEGIFTGNANGGPVIFTPDQVNTLYSAIGGYVPGDIGGGNLKWRGGVKPLRSGSIGPGRTP